jgi:hypothetical protein
MAFFIAEGVALNKGDCCIEFHLPFINDFICIEFLFLHKIAHCKPILKNDTIKCSYISDYM